MLKMEINSGTNSVATSAATSVAVSVGAVTETTTNLVTSPSPTSSPPPPLSPPKPPQPPVVLSPCAACKILRRRCAEKCVLAPYFPPTDPAKFTIAHRVFGASNIIKFLQELPESQRTDAVNSMVYEAGARLRDPVYGCAGAIYHLQKQVSELQAHLANAHAQLVSMQLERSDLVELIYKMDQKKLISSTQEQEQGQDKIMSFESSFESGDDFISTSPDEESNDLGFLEDNNNNNNNDSSMSWWDPLWT